MSLRTDGGTSSMGKFGVWTQEALRRATNALSSLRGADAFQLAKEASSVIRRCTQSPDVSASAAMVSAARESFWVVFAPRSRLLGRVF